MIQRRAAIVLVPLAIFSSSFTAAYQARSEADVIRTTELARLRALVTADVVAARELHADDFQLINPVGESLSKAEYLGGIESRELDYLVWEPTSPIEVRVHGDAAVIRYRSRLEIIVRNQKLPLRPHWHTDSYEKRNGRWQVVWSQATRIE